MLIARGRLKHQYPHSWRSKKPIIFRNTPQWFIAMDKDDRRSQATRCAPAPMRAICRNPMGAAARAEPHQRHDREQARLGDLAPARLGRADRRLHQGKAGRLGRYPRRPRGRTCASSRPSSRRAPTPGTRPARASAFSAEARGRSRGKKSTTFSTSGSIRARRMPSCWKTRCISPRSPASNASATAATTP